LWKCIKDGLFKKIDPKDSGIHFSNRISENDTMNILTFEYINNGGGVAMADFNNDSLVTCILQAITFLTSYTSTTPKRINTF
jgi:hypothetical protein